MRSRKLLKTSLLGGLLLWVTAWHAWGEDWTYRIREGENLTMLVERYLKSEFTAEQLQDYNGIVEDRRTPVGFGIQIPIDWMKALIDGVRVSRMSGTAKLRHINQDDWVELEIDTVLQAGDRIMTGADSRVSVVFADGSSLQIGENSEVVFDALSAFQGKGMLDTRIHLQRGRLENQVVPRIHPKSRYEIHTPAAVTVVRGTAFRVAVTAPSGETRTEVNEGRVGVSAQGETTDLSSGEGVQVIPGDPPGKPRMLLPKPDLDGMDIQQADHSLQLNWPDLALAQRYRVQLIDLQGTLVDEVLTPVSQSRLSLPVADIYVLGIRGIDEQDWEGLEGKRVVEIAGSETVAKTPHEPTGLTASPPLLYPPLITPRGVLFRWTATPGAWAYRLLLSRDPDGHELLFERLGFDLGFEMAGPLPGFGYVRVEALTDNADQPLTSPVIPLSLPRGGR
ncbi:MAG: FecR domain-containing protein [Candidatus Thiodiazotropha sp.]